MQDFDDVRNHVTETITDGFARVLTDGIKTLVTEALDGCLKDMINTVIDETDDEDTAADNDEYYPGEVGADDESEQDQRRADYIAGYRQAYSELREAFEAANNL
jgi:hypothetical protein